MLLFIRSDYLDESNFTKCLKQHWELKEIVDFLFFYTEGNIHSSQKFMKKELETIWYEMHQGLFKQIILIKGLYKYMKRSSNNKKRIVLILPSSEFDFKLGYEIHTIIKSSIISFVKSMREFMAQNKIGVSIYRINTEHALCENIHELSNCPEIM